MQNAVTTAVSATARQHANRLKRISYAALFETPAFSFETVKYGKLTLLRSVLRRVTRDSTIIVLVSTRLLSGPMPPVIAYDAFIKLPDESWTRTIDEVSYAELRNETDQRLEEAGID